MILRLILYVSFVKYKLLGLFIHSAATFQIHMLTSVCVVAGPALSLTHTHTHTTIDEKFTEGFYLKITIDC